MPPERWLSPTWLFCFHALWCLATALVARGLHRPATAGQSLLLWAWVGYGFLQFALAFFGENDLWRAVLLQGQMFADLFVVATWLFLRQSRRTRAQTVTGAMVLLSLWLLELYFFTPLPLLPRLSGVLFMATALALCFHYFLRLGQSSLVVRFQQHPGFWLVMGFLPYCIIGLMAQLVLASSVGRQAADLPLPMAALQSAGLVWRGLALIIAFSWYKRKFTSGRS